MKYFFFLSLFTPMLAMAAAPTNFKEFVTIVLKVIQNTISIFIVAVVVGMLYGVMLYMINSDNDKKREELRGYLIYAVIGLSVIMSMWGIIEILTSTLGWGLGVPQITAH